MRWTFGTWPHMPCNPNILRAEDLLRKFMSEAARIVNNCVIMPIAQNLGKIVVYAL
jgi:hypothetical protein